MLVAMLNVVEDNVPGAAAFSLVGSSSSGKRQQTSPPSPASAPQKCLLIFDVEICAVLVDAGHRCFTIPIVNEVFRCGDSLENRLGR